MASPEGQTTTNWKNVNNWHWIESDCSTWAHECLKKHLSTLPGLKEIKQVKGDESVNQRKGRVKQIWDLEIELEMQDGSKIRVKDLMSDQSREEMSMIEGKQWRNHLWEKIEAFRAEVLEVQGKPLLVGVDESAEGSLPKVRLPSIVKDEQGNQSLTNGIIEDSVEFMAKPEDLFSALTDLQRMMIWSRGTARIQGSLMQPGTIFSLFDGNVSGIVRSLNPPYNIVLDWRLPHWPSGHHSSVNISLESKPDKTVLKLVQRGVPLADVEGTKANWKRFYWDPIKMSFGYGTFL
jgi:activator of HSP90 ATPase